MAPKTRNKRESSKGTSSQSERRATQHPDNPSDGWYQSDGEAGPFYRPTSTRPRFEATSLDFASSYIGHAPYSSYSSTASTSTSRQSANYATVSGPPHDEEILPQPSHTVYTGTGQEAFNQLPEQEWVEPDEGHELPENITTESIPPPHGGPGGELLSQQSHAGYTGTGQEVPSELPEEEWVDPDEAYLPPENYAAESMSSHDDRDGEFLPPQSHAGYTGKGKEVLNPLREGGWVGPYEGHVPAGNIRPDLASDMAGMNLHTGSGLEDNAAPSGYPGSQPYSGPYPYDLSAAELAQNEEYSAAFGSMESRARKASPRRARDKSSKDSKKRATKSNDHATPVMAAGHDQGYEEWQYHPGEMHAAGHDQDYEEWQHHPEDMRAQVPNSHQPPSRHGELPGSGTAGYNQGLEGGAYYPEPNAQAAYVPQLSSQAGLPGDEGAGYGEGWDDGTSHPNDIAQAPYHQPSNLAGHYEAGSPADEAGPSGETPALSERGPSRTVHISKGRGKKVFRVPCHRRLDATFPVLCKSIVDKMEPKVEKLQKKFCVFGDVYARTRTLLSCAEEDAYGNLGDWENVEFYIVLDLKKDLNYNMVFPGSFD